MMAGSPRTWGSDQRRLVSLDEAWAIIAAQVRPLGSESVALSEAHGRVLVASLLATEDSPAFDRAVMDGFAVRSVDCATPGAELRIVGLAAAGAASPPVEIGPGQAVRINTGAMLPDGADAIARIEDCRVTDDQSAVTIATSIKPGLHLVHRGEHRRAGGEIVGAPRLLRPGDIAAAAAIGASRVTVSREVGVSIVATGDELVLPGATRQPGQIFESNGLMLSAMIREFGGTPVNMGIVADDESALKRAFVEALKQPVVVVAGGMSMGTLDLVPKVLADLGVKWLFHGVDMRPGKPVAYGIGPAGQHIFGLPGNPGSAFVCGHVMVRTAIDGLRGLPSSRPSMIRVGLGEDIPPAKDARPAFLPARVWSNPAGGCLVKRCRWGGSGDVLALAEANALLYRREPAKASSAGESAEAVMLTSDAHPMPVAPA